MESLGVSCLRNLYCYPTDLHPILSYTQALGTGCHIWTNIPSLTLGQEEVAERPLSLRPFCLLGTWVPRWEEKASRAVMLMSLYNQPFKTLSHGILRKWQISSLTHPPHSWVPADRLESGRTCIFKEQGRVPWGTGDLEQRTCRGFFSHWHWKERESTGNQEIWDHRLAAWSPSHFTSLA